MTYKIGTTIATTNNRVYVTLRLGRITETSKVPRDGFFPATTRNQAGEEYHFFARTWDNLTGYVKELKWYQNTLDNGTVLNGWKLVLDVGEDKDYVLDIGTKKRPFNHFMSALANADFTRPIRFVGFMGKDGNKVLKLTQDQNEAGKPIWIAPKIDMKFLSRDLIDKLKRKEPLTEAEERNLARDDKGKIQPQMKYDEIDGSFSEGYPYVFQNAKDEKWNFSVYTAFLIDYTNQVTAPRIVDESRNHPTITRKVTPDADEFPTHAGYDAPLADDLKEIGHDEPPFHYGDPPDADDSIPF